MRRVELAQNRAHLWTLVLRGVKTSGSAPTLLDRPILYGYKTWSFVLMEKHSLNVSENIF